MHRLGIGYVLASSVVYRWLETLLGKIKDYKIVMCCFVANRAALRTKSKDWLAQKEDNAG